MQINITQTIDMNVLADYVTASLSNEDIVKFITSILNNRQELELDECVLATVYNTVKKCYVLDNEHFDMDHLVKKHYKD